MSTFSPDTDRISGHAARSAIPAIAAVMVSAAVDREVSSNADMYNGSSPSRPSGIDYNGDALQGVGLRRGGIDSSPGQLLRTEKISAGGRESPQLRRVMCHPGTAQMCIKRRVDIARCE